MHTATAPAAPGATAPAAASATAPAAASARRPQQPAPGARSSQRHRAHWLPGAVCLLPGASQAYVRLELLMREATFRILAGKLRALVGGGTAGAPTA